MDLREKIIICLDLSSEMAEKDLKSSDGKLYDRLTHVKRAIRIFVNIKSQISLKHEYALMVLQETACWLEDFTSDPNEFIERLDYLNQTVDCSAADINTIFDVIYQSVKLPNNSFVNEIAQNEDQFLLRLILFYGRSNCIPIFTKLKESFVEISSNNLVFIDVLYAHEKIGNEIDNINKVLCDLDINGNSYVLNSIWSLTDIYNEFIKLLSHPLQRAKENDADYNLKNFYLSQSLIQISNPKLKISENTSDLVDETHE